MSDTDNLSQRLYRNDQRISQVESNVAVNNNRISQLERRCDIKDNKFDKLESDRDKDNENNQIKFDALFAYQNRAIGYAMCAGAIAAGIFYIFINKVL